MSKLHITSFLRARGRLDSLNDPSFDILQQQLQQQQQQQPPHHHNQRHQLDLDAASVPEAALRSINKFEELLPTLQFVAQVPIAATRPTAISTAATTTTTSPEGEEEAPAAAVKTTSPSVSGSDASAAATTTATTTTTSPSRDSTSSNNNNSNGPDHFRHCDDRDDDDEDAPGNRSSRGSCIIPHGISATTTTSNDRSTTTTTTNTTTPTSGEFLSGAEQPSEQQKQQQEERQEELQEPENNFSFNADGSSPPPSASATASSSFFDEPTSSISIEMHNLGNDETASGTTAATTGPSTIATSSAATGTDFGPATSATTTHSSHRSAMTTITTPSSDAADPEEDSIEEEIEEAIELSAAALTDDEDDHDVSSNDRQRASAASGFASGSLKLPLEKPDQQHPDLFGIGSDGSEPLSGSSAVSGSLGEAAASAAASGEEAQGQQRSASDGGEFRINEDELSGGQLAQHFVLDDEDDEEDEDEEQDINSHSAGNVPVPLEGEVQQGVAAGGAEFEDDNSEFSLPLPQPAHLSSPFFATSVAQPTQLLADRERPRTPTAKCPSSPNQSTTEDISELIEETHSEAATRESQQEPGESASEATALQQEALSFGGSTAAPAEYDIQLAEEARMDEEIVTPTNESVKGFDDVASENASADQMPIPPGEHEERIHSLEKDMAEPNQLADVTFDDHDLSSLNPSFDINNETLVNRLLDDTLDELPLNDAGEGDTDKAFIGTLAAEIAERCTNNMITDLDDSPSKPLLDSAIAEDDEEEEMSMELMKLRILAMKLQQQPKETVSIEGGQMVVSTDSALARQMERVPLNEFSKDVLEDITEESERNSLSTAEEQRSLSADRTGSTTARSESHTLHEGDLRSDAGGAAAEGGDLESSVSVVSLNMIRMLEQKVCDLQNVLVSKDACLTSLTLQLDATQRREPGCVTTFVTEQPISSGRESSSLVTNSTEYRTFQDDFGAPTMDIYMELTKRDELIAKLTESLTQSMSVREGLQADGEKLNNEIQLLRKQLTEAMETLRRPAAWSRQDQESNCGQRISEISMDLVSESDDDLERQFLTDNEDKFSRCSRERQLSVPRQVEITVTEAEQPNEWFSQTPFSKQIEQFQKYLTPAEVRLFFMVQKKFDDFLGEELEKCKMKNEQELKAMVDQLETEKDDKDKEIKRLSSAQLEKDETHSKEMEGLRKYFESKCAELEKQYSDDVFSHKSAHQGADTSSECSSDPDQLPEDAILPPSMARTRSKESSPRKRSRAELLLSPSHRQLTPSTDAYLEERKDDNANISLEITDLKSFYQNKIHEMQHTHDEQLRQLSDKVKYYERRYPDDEFMANRVFGAAVIATRDAVTETSLTTHVQDANTSLIVIDQDELNANNEAQVIQRIIEEYEVRLQEQLALARQDIVRDLEQQFQTLLSESTTDDQHWPPELILLREKFTAKSQLEIAQLQIKHEDEMSRLKMDYEKQLNRKNKRNSTFDAARDLAEAINERDSLRELAKSFRHVLTELARCVVNCEDELNATLMDDVQRLLAANSIAEATSKQNPDQLTLNASILNATLNSTRQSRLVPDVQSLLEVVEDPSLVQFIGNKSAELSEDFDLKDCLERLKGEAAYLLQLSENIAQRRQRVESEDGGESSGAEKNDSCCEAEDGPKMQYQSAAGQKFFLRTNSFNEQHLSAYPNQREQPTQPLGLTSLPPDLNRLRFVECMVDDNSSITAGNASELNFQVHELKNRLVKSETDRVKLQEELEHTIHRNAELGQELQGLRDQLSQMNSLNQTDYAEGYGLGSIKSPQRISGSEKSSFSFVQLQEKARSILTSPPQEQRGNDATIVLLQMIDDFCREGDKVVEGTKKDREDLQSQIDTADKQLRATRQFLEEQATEREQERDEFVREIESLKVQLRDKEKERSNLVNASEEFEQFETQIRDLLQKLQDANAKKDKFETELKASIDKIFVLREIISELETQVETKALNEHVLEEKAKQLEDYINAQTQSNETLQNEVHSLKVEIDEGYQPRIHVLQEKLQNIRPTAEQSMVLNQVVEQLRDIESTLDQKTKTLESLHNSAASSNSCSLSIAEDVSVHGTRPFASLPAGMGDGDQMPSVDESSPVHPSPRQHSLTMEGVQRVADKLSKHTRVEEAAIKRIRDLEMQVVQMRGACVELQSERDSLQDRMSEQTQRITALQSRLEDQRQRAEELQRAGTSDLNIRIHDLQMEVQALREKLSVRDKQIATMKQQLEKSKNAIDRLEAELAVEQQPDRSQIERLQAEVKQKTGEIQKLKEKIKNEMINKLALPDLMETMLADKNEEIDHLKEQLEAKEKELLELSQASSVGAGGNGGAAKEEASTKLSARTLSDIVSIAEFEEPDVIRRAMAPNLDTPIHLDVGGTGDYLQQTIETSKEAFGNLTEKRTDDLSGFAAPLSVANTFEHPHYFQDPHAAFLNLAKTASTPGDLVPRQINFSELTEDSKLKTPSAFQTPENITLKQGNEKLLQEIVDLRAQLDALLEEKETALAAKAEILQSLEADLLATKLRLKSVEEEMQAQKAEIAALCEERKKQHYERQQEMTAKSMEIDQLVREQRKLIDENQRHMDLLSKQDKELLNRRANEERQAQRITELEFESLRATENEVNERECLRKELRSLGEAHKMTLREGEMRKQENERLNQDVKARDERVQVLTSKLSVAENHAAELSQKVATLESETEKLRQQLNSDNSSKQFSVDEIAQQVEKELNYSAQLDSNILRAIESEEENNLDHKSPAKQAQSKTPEAQGTDDENFTGERELLNQLEALRAQLTVEREQGEAVRQDLLAEKQHSQAIQEQDVIIIEAMRKRLETALAQEDELHKQMDIERERCERLQTQLNAQQRAESRRNSLLLLKSPTDSPRRSPRSLNDFESELAERLRSEIKMLTAQNERERERSVDLQRGMERERQRYDTELQDRIQYCERLNREMEKLAREKDAGDQECEHLQERLTLQTQEIESLEARLATLQEAETRRSTRLDRQHKESTQQLAEMQELRAQLLTAEAARDSLQKTITNLRYDVERSAQREAKLAEALAAANSNLKSADATVPQQFLQKMKEINALLAENTQENRQMAETVQFLVEERRQLQQKCEELEGQLNGSANVNELEERCNHLLGRYLRVESHRKALVYQKRYLKISLQSYLDSEQRAIAAIQGGELLKPRRDTKKLFKTVALAIVAIQRMKFIGRIWHTGKRIVSKSVFTITQQRRSQPPVISSTTVTAPSTPTPLTLQRPPLRTPSPPQMALHQQHQQQQQHRAQHPHQQQQQQQRLLWPPPPCISNSPTTSSSNNSLYSPQHSQPSATAANGPKFSPFRPVSPLQSPALMRDAAASPSSPSPGLAATHFDWPRPPHLPAASAALTTGQLQHQQQQQQHHQQQQQRSRPPLHHATAQ